MQADPIPGLDIVTKAGLVRTSFVIDGMEVPALITARDSTHYRIRYAGHLRSGVHRAYLKWADAAGGWGARAWRFPIGSPYATSAAPRLTLSSYQIHLGERLSVTGNTFTSGALVAIRFSGPNTPPGVPVAAAVVDRGGIFRLQIRFTRYPDNGARAGGMMHIDATARGMMIGDLHEGDAVPVYVVD